ncbi:hypothetical protein [Hymenobacter cheonanensis]|uniref:hypothetical protein n=1 Tax=Hymenobacter sp. CA2-7 TaxID=3063993 RepID=UPI0027126A02|nr:hypothetical protein [Hymenobacter sp. CA2-7]MDO7884189.1 hypothetical protein [Hymenobacter sp. CA2-7]
MHYLIDTNVPLAANGKSDAGPACVLTAVQRLVQLQTAEKLVLDSGFLILKEYQNKLSPTGQPGVGDAFLLWAWRNHTNSKHCELATLELAEDGSFAAFPNDPALAAFDPSDRKFVAAALTHAANPPIVNATDTDWHKDHAALNRNGVQIEFLCMEEMTKPRR